MNQDRLKEMLIYDPTTGVFRWRVRPNGRICVGDEAGNVHVKGYRYIQLDRRLYFAHRLAWLYMTGEWPKGQVDHKNARRDDNRWKNLRDVTREVNAQNRRTASVKNSAGLLGVSKHYGKFQATIFVGGKNRHLGTFVTAETAHAAYVGAKRRLHEGNTL